MKLLDPRLPHTLFFFPFFYVKVLLDLIFPDDLVLCVSILRLYIDARVMAG